MATESAGNEDGLATAIGHYVLGDISLGKAAEQVGMSRWEFEAVLDEAGFENLYGSRTPGDLESELDAVGDEDGA